MPDQVIHTEPIYLDILLRIREKTVVPFFGAGASMGPPPALAAAPATDSLRATEPTVPNVYAPSATTLAAKLAMEFGLRDLGFSPEIQDLAKVTSYGDVKKARATLRKLLHDELGKDLTAGPIHQVVGDLAEHLRLIVTTNYDLLLEKAMGKRPFHLVVQGGSEDDPPGEGLLWWRPGMSTTDRPVKLSARQLDRELNPEKADAPIIYKLHGSVLPENDSFVISEADYVKFLHTMQGHNGVPSFFTKYIYTRSLLFLGYSLADWNVRVLLRSFFNHKRRDDLPHWAITLNVKPLEKLLWEARGIDVFNMTVDEFAAGLRARM